MGERKIDDLWQADHQGTDQDWQGDMTWLKTSGNVPGRRRSMGEGLTANFEKNPLIWAFAIVMIGGLIFLMATQFLF